MLVPICEKCYKKFVATKAKISPPHQDPDISIEEYLKSFQTYIEEMNDFIATEVKNKEKFNKFVFLSKKDLKFTDLGL